MRWPRGKRPPLCREGGRGRSQERTLVGAHDSSARTEQGMRQLPDHNDLYCYMEEQPAFVGGEAPLVRHCTSYPAEQPRGGARFVRKRVRTGMRSALPVAMSLHCSCKEVVDVRRPAFQNYPTAYRAAICLSLMEWAYPSIHIEVDRWRLVRNIWLLAIAIAFFVSLELLLLLSRMDARPSTLSRRDARHRE